MFNVLPQEQKNEIKKEYSTRRFLVLVAFCVTTLAIATVLLLPAYMMSNINNKNIKEELAQVTEELKKTQTEIVTPEQTVALREKILIINSSKQDVSPYSLFSDVIKAKTNSIRISSFSYSKQTADEGDTLSVSGTALTRDALTQFERNLEAQTQFVDVDLPISNLAKDRDIKFILTISVRSKK